MQQNADEDFIQTPGGNIPAAKVLRITDIVFIDGEEVTGPRKRKFTVIYGVDGIVLEQDIVDDNHLVRERLEGIHKTVLAKVAAKN
ncbi:MAG: hypothetical protein DI628_02190 [Blastochloris viridis]|uniref:Uncharacterized protein n=1 Tax=Blastochloris viridis TaxID=1079 RepID=A0A6N4R8D4_BLAVI|nr:MAG: hypothetical protein DI628_02190 [Blastochloris viridis]